MKNQLAFSSYSVRELLGPVKISFRGPDGKKVNHAWGDQPATLDLLDLPRLVQEKLGINSLEICQFHIPERTPEYLDRLKSALTAAGVSLINVPIDVGNISDPNTAYREEDLAEVEEWIRAMAALGTRMVRVNASAPMSGEAAPVEVTIDSYRRLARLTDSLGVQLLLENHGGITTDPAVIVRIVEAVGSPRLKTLVDIGNFEPLMSVGMAKFQGKEPPDISDLSPLYDGIARVAPYAGLVHAKTHEFDEQGNDRQLDVVRALRIVRDTGYTGPVSIEYEGGAGDPWENSLRTKALVEKAFA